MRAMSLDAISLAMVEPLLPQLSVLCLGVPDMPDGMPFEQFAKDKGAIRVDAVDIIKHKGWEQIVDLNFPVHWEHYYDLVINPGTLEHCFNIGQAWTNAWEAVAEKGWMVSVMPVTLLNHGYWNVSPIAFTDWCTANGGRLKRLQYAINGKSQTLIEVSAIPESKSGRGCFPPETVAYALMKKEQRVPLHWPTQGVYR